MRKEPRKTNFARKLRASQTDAERKMWNLLRDRSLLGQKFRRQHPVGPYVVDFCCCEKKVIVEIDGGQHQEARERDKARERYLGQLGYSVLRFWNHDVLMNADAVMEKIILEFRKIVMPAPHLSPLPRGERRKR